MFHSTRLLVLLMVFTVALRADGSLEQAERAQSLLGSETWSQIIRIENVSRSHRYPRIVHALVFELAGRLWFYTPTDGTQSFSLHYGELEREKADFGPLLRDIEPGFVRWSEVPVPPADRSDPKVTASLPNGCFIESVATLRKCLARGLPLREPRLLSYYRSAIPGVAGHTVLAYDLEDEVEVFDPGRPGGRLVFGKSLGRDALALARAVEGREVVKARYIPVFLPVSAATVAAAHDVRRDEVGTVPKRS